MLTSCPSGRAHVRGGSMRGYSVWNQCFRTHSCTHPIPLSASQHVHTHIAHMSYTSRAPSACKSHPALAGITHSRLIACTGNVLARTMPACSTLSMSTGHIRDHTHLISPHASAQLQARYLQNGQLPEYRVFHTMFLCLFPLRI